MGQALNVRFTRKSGFQAQPSRVGAIRGSDALEQTLATGWRGSKALDPTANYRSNLGVNVHERQQAQGPR
jgi:hypothetical protein